MWNLHQIMCKASRKNGALAGEKEDGPAMTPSKPVPFYTQHISIPDKDAQKEKNKFFAVSYYYFPSPL